MTTAKTSYNVAPNGNESGGGGLPVGSITIWTTAKAPEGWLVCDGSAISRTTYATLFSVIGTTYGAGDGSTTFNVPNTGGKTIRGLGGSFTPINFSAGNDIIYLYDNQLPVHYHGITDPGHSHTVVAMSETYTVNAGVGGDRAGNNGTRTTATATTGILQTDANPTSNDPVNVVNTFITLNFIIKVA